MNGLTITRHVINGVVCLYLGGLQPNTDVVQWRPHGSALTATATVVERDGSDNAIVAVSIPRDGQSLYDVRECFSNPGGADCEVNDDGSARWHLETGPLECLDDTRDGCDTMIWHRAAP